ncbi:hypothetical protein GT025_05110 [Streptomyces sp. SID4920]|nr:hypothetical protein [Streptomyces sp. SID4920]MYX63890.1 hypothetical protein [Streptomyces sp. SID8373]
MVGSDVFAGGGFDDVAMRLEYLYGPFPRQDRDTAADRDQVAPRVAWLCGGGFLGGTEVDVRADGHVQIRADDRHRPSPAEHSGLRAVKGGQVRMGGVRFRHRYLLGEGG